MTLQNITAMNEDDNKIYKFMKELNMIAAQELIKAYNGISSDIPIKFPIYHNEENEGKKRVSEQELRFAMAYMFNSNKIELKDKEYFFSIETPTLGKYKFSKKEVSDPDSKKQQQRSAQTDMTLYEKKEPIINIEFKANNPKQESFDKDIEKLLSENIHIGAWCHILESANNGTCKSLLGKLGKFEIAFNNVSNQNKLDQIKSKPIYFSFLVLNKGTYYSK